MEIKNIILVGKYPEQIESIKNQINNGDSFLNIVNGNEHCDLYLAFDLIDLVWLNNPENQKVTKVLIRQEPKIVMWQTYIKSNIAKFNHIVDIGKPRFIQNEVINWPQDLTLYVENQKTKNNRIVMVNSNLLSLEIGENYSLRRRAVKRILDLDLYGYQWNNSYSIKIRTLLIELKKFVNKKSILNIRGLRYYFSNYDNYLGETKNKRETISNYKYCLVIENSSSYLSEKLFDALLSGCIPIYVGPNLLDFEFPQNLYLQAKPNLVDIKLKFEEAKKINFVEWTNNLNLWLKDSKTYENWSKDLFLPKLLKIVQNYHQ
jgi:hypothetical protein